MLVDFFKRRNGIKMPTRYYSITTLTLTVATSFTCISIVNQKLYAKTCMTRQSIKNIHRYPPSSPSTNALLRF